MLKMMTLGKGHVRPPTLADGLSWNSYNIPWGDNPDTETAQPTSYSSPGETNRLLSQDRVIVERYLGQPKLYWGFCKGPTDVTEPRC